MPHFERYIGIDYSGAEMPDSSCKRLRMYVTEGSGTPIQVHTNEIIIANEARSSTTTPK